MKKGILLINLGTPNSPSVSDVRKYLREFLMDKYVIDLPYLQRWLLVNIIIITFRAPKSSKAYQQLWTENGSPLLVNSQQLAKKTQQKLKKDWVVKLGMRYGNPSIKEVLIDLTNKNIDELLVIPLYPQYASSTTLSSINEAKKQIEKVGFKGRLSFIENFIDNSSFIASLAENGLKYLNTTNYDYILFSYHGVPERHILNDDINNNCKLSNACCEKYCETNRLCYRAQCYETTRLLCKELNISNNFSTVFQSRLITRAKEPWLRPYADEVIVDLAKKGVKNILVFSPAFVVDCLETSVEIGIEYKELFQQHGGELLQLVECTNDKAEWLVDLIQGNNS